MACLPREASQFAWCRLLGIASGKVWLWTYLIIQPWVWSQAILNQHFLVFPLEVALTAEGEPVPKEAWGHPLLWSLMFHTKISYLM